MQQPEAVLVATTERPAGYEVVQTLGQVFGVVVRVLGLTMVLWGLYTLTYLVDGIGIGVSTRSAAQALGGFLVTEIFWLVGGLALLRGEWLVRFAYGGAAAG